MASEDVSEAAATRVLQSLSRESGRSLGEIALEVVLSRTTPDTTRATVRAHRPRRGTARMGKRVGNLECVSWPPQPDS